MANIKISELTPKGANLSSTDLLEISEDTGGGTYVTKSISGAEIIAAAGGVNWGNIQGDIYDQTDLQSELSLKQEVLSSGWNIKTINNIDILGPGNISVANLITANNYFPYYSASTEKFLDSGLFYNNGSINSLYHMVNSFGNTVPNLIFDQDAGIYQIGSIDDVFWTNPQTGIKFDIYNNSFNLTVGNAFNSKIQIAFGQTFVQGGDFGSGSLQMSDWNSSLSNFMGTVNLQAPNGISMYANDAEVYMFAQRVNMQVMDRVIFQAPDVRFADASIFETGTKTQSNRYLRILDENQVAYYLPLYQ
jgi:hypothetical protein